MSQNNFIKLPLLAILFCLLFSSCFKDVDLEQAQEIQLTPDVDADLLFYHLDETDFLDSETNTFTPVIRDTVRLEFLDDDYIQDGLQYAEFRFRHENKFPNTIASKIRFLGENNRSQFSVNYEIPAGSESSPVIVDTVHVIQGSEIGKVKKAIKMVVELKMLGAGKNSKGELDFSSKGLFKFEF